MKIRHNIKQDGCTLSGQILETIFEEGGKRGDNNSCYSSDKEFLFISASVPQLQNSILYVWGDISNRDGIQVSYTYDTPEEAKNALEHINEFTKKGEKSMKVEERNYLMINKDNEIVDTLKTKKEVLEHASASSYEVIDISNAPRYNKVTTSRMVLQKPAKVAKVAKKKGKK